MKNTIKKLIIFGLVVFCVSFGFGGAVFAEDDNNNTSTNTGSCETFLGMSSWDCRVDLTAINSTENLKKYIWVIVANIATDATLLAAYLALGFVIYGGYLYIFSGGDVGKVTTGKKTLTMSFIGLGIVMLANIIFNGLKYALIKDGSAVTESGLHGLPSIEAEAVFTNAVSWVVSIAGFAAVIFLVYGGVSYITASGDAGKLTRAKNAIIYSLIGLAIVGLSEIILGFVSSNIRKSAADASSYIVDGQEIALMEEKHEK